MGRCNITLCIIACVLALLTFCHCEIKYFANSDATQALLPSTTTTIKVAVTQVPDVGYYFIPSAGPSYSQGGPNVTRGYFILPEHETDHVAYAPIARALALRGFFVGLLNTDNLSHTAVSAVVRKVMQENPKQFWSAVGHGKGGRTASLLVQSFFPKIKGLGLLGSSVDSTVNLSGFVLPAITMYGPNDLIVPQSISQADLVSTLPNSAYDGPIAGANHATFAAITTEYANDGVSTVARTAVLSTITDALFLLGALTHYPSAMQEVLFYGDVNINSPYALPVPVNKQNFRYVEGEGNLADKSWHVFQPFNPTKVAYVHYVGAACPPEAYFKFASDLADKGVTVFIPNFSLNYGLKGFNITSSIIAAHPNITNWSVGGHSYGAIAASYYVQAYPNKVKAFLLYASGNLCPNCNFTTYDVKTLLMWGSRDTVGGPQAFKEKLIPKLPADTIYHEVVGGNHYHFGYYGYQYPDTIALVSREEQQRQMVLYSDQLLSQFKS